MKITVFDINGNEIEMPSPLSVSIAQEEDVPADIMSAVFAFDDMMPELKSVCVSQDKEILFSGTVDKQTVYHGDGVPLLKITCRSMAAPLLDSEAYPRSYVLPSIDVLYEVCLKPYGIKGVIGECKAVSTVYEVDKGMSVWQVIDDFCSRFLNVKPKITPDGYLDITGGVKGDTLIFSNPDGNIYSELTKTINRHNQISHVEARLDLNDGYGYTVKNSDAVARGIYNVRYLNCAELPNEYLSLADKIIANSKRNSLQYTLKCPYMLLNVLGRWAEISDDVAGSDGGLAVASCEYRLDSGGEYTKINLRKDV